ncbi:MAG: hypothetical protein J6T10_07325 [Methanobrevibacter sp.]|nr:hypothetical protein [Methanobrevibacter sp.]
MTNIIEETELIIGRATTPKEYTMLMDLKENYDEKDILHYIYIAKFKDRPIDYARVVIIKKCKKKNESSGSEWWDRTKKELEEKESSTDSEWLENWKKQFR